MSDKCKHGLSTDNPCIMCDEERGEEPSSLAPVAGSMPLDGCTATAIQWSKKHTLDNRIQEIAQYLPDGWQVHLSIENGAAWVDAERPDGTRVTIEDPDGDIRDWLREALRLAIDETQADAMSASNKQPSDPNVG